MVDVNVIKMPTSSTTLPNGWNLMGKTAKPKINNNINEDTATWVNNSGKMRDSEKESKEKTSKPQTKILQKSVEKKQLQSCSSTMPPGTPTPSVQGNNCKNFSFN